MRRLTPHGSRGNRREVSAEVENIVKEAALISLRNERESVTFKDIGEAIERVDLGLETHLELTPEERERVAYHESDIFSSSTGSTPGRRFLRLPLRPAWGPGSRVPFAREELFTKNPDELFANVKTALAGYVAEKIKYSVTSTGVGSDFEQAMRLAHSMVWHYGMGTNGFVGDFTIIRTPRSPNDIKDKLNQEVQDILHQAAKRSGEVPESEWDLMDELAAALLARDELDYDEIEAIFKAHGKERTPA